MIGRISPRLAIVTACVVLSASGLANVSIASAPSAAQRDSGVPVRGVQEVQSRAGFEAAIRDSASTALPSLAERLGGSGTPLPIVAHVASDDAAFELSAVSPDFFGTSSDARPSDGTIGVGPAHIVQAVNKAIAIYTKTGAPVMSESLNAFFGVPETVFITDPRVLFDPVSQRWLVVALQNSRATRASYLFYGFSATSDPTGQYCFYSSNQTTGNDTFTSVQADFPGLGYDEFGIYLTLARYSWGLGFPADSKIIMLPRSPLLACSANFSAATWLTTQPLPGDFDAPVIMPTVSFGATPAEYFVASQVTGGQYVGLWQITNRADPTVATLSFMGATPVGPYAAPQPALQRGSTIPVDLGDARTTTAAVWRNGSLFFAFGVNTGYQTDGVEWLELTTASRAVRQSGLLQFNAGSYAMPAVMVDASGGMALVAAVTGANFFLGTAVATRAAGDPLGQMSQPTIFANGLGAYEDPVALDTVHGERWGDYFGVALDPDGRQIWVEGSYAANSLSWGTAIASTVASAPAVSSAYRLSTTPASVVAGASATVVAQLTSLAGVPISEPGHAVTWSAQPAAQFTPATSVTDGSGRAVTQLLSGPTPTTYTLRALDSNGATGTLVITTTVPRVATSTIYLPNITKTLGGPSGWVTPFFVQNAGTVPTDLEVTFYRFSDGSQVAQRNISAVGPGASFADNPDADLDLPDSTQFSVVARSFGAPIVAAVNQLQTTATGAQEALSYAGFSTGSTTVYVPNVTRRFFGYDVPLIVQNLGPAVATVAATFTSFDGTQAVPISLSVGPGRSGVIDPDFTAGLTDGTQYAVKLVSNQPIGVVANAHNEVIGPVAFSHNGLASGATAVYAPYATKGAATFSPVVIQNLGTTASPATLTFTPLGGGATQTFTTPSISPGASRAFDVRFANGTALANAPVCTTASATCLGNGNYSLLVTSGSAIAAVVLPNSTITAAGYVAQTAPTNKIVLPIVARNAAGWNTSIYVQSINAGGATANYYIVGGGLLAATQSLILTPGQGMKIDVAAVNGLTNGGQYSVVISASGSVTAIADEINLSPGDGDMIYEGFPVP